MKETVKVIEGTHAAAYGAMLSRVKVIAAYPITPQTSVIEKLAEACARGDLEARFIKVESEHSAMAACIGASATGARAFTATSSQGLLLMHELLHWAAGDRLPIVMVNGNRAVAAPWSVYADQTDSVSQRDTGWLQVYCESNQEVLDTLIQAYKVAEGVMLPCMVNLDAFFLTHTSEPVSIPQQDMVDRFLPPYRPRYKLDVDEPHTIGGITGPQWYMELRYKIQKAMEEAKDAFTRAGEEFGEVFGRRYGLVEEYRCDGADVILVTSGTITSNARIAVDSFREGGINVGLLKIRVLRPFPTEEVRRATQNAQKLVVIDRNISFGQGGVFGEEVKSALYNAGHRPQVFGFVAGLGGRDVRPKDVADMARFAIEAERPEDDIIWMGVKR